MDNSFETSVSSVVNKDRELEIVASELKLKYADFAKANETKNKISNIDRIEQEFQIIQKITMESVGGSGSGSGGTSSSTTSSSSSSGSGSGSDFSNAFRKAYKKKFEHGVYPIGVYDLLPDSKCCI